MIVQLCMRVCARNDDDKFHFYSFMSVSVLQARKKKGMHVSHQNQCTSQAPGTGVRVTIAACCHMQFHRRQKLLKILATQEHQWR